ncbi:MAG: S8 family serine peptidase [Maricaulaceae bacterium]
MTRSKLLAYSSTSLMALLLTGCSTIGKANPIGGNAPPEAVDAINEYFGSTPNRISTEPVVIGYKVNLIGIEENYPAAARNLAVNTRTLDISTSIGETNNALILDGPYVDGSYEVKFSGKQKTSLSQDRLKALISASFTEQATKSMRAAGVIAAGQELPADVRINLEEVLLVQPYQVSVTTPADYSGWHLGTELGAINATAAWRKTQGSGSIIAVIDSGVISHPLLNLEPGFDFVGDATTSRDNDAYDPDATDSGNWRARWECVYNPTKRMNSYHGTHVAGIAAAMPVEPGDNFSGVAPGATIRPVRVLGPCGGASTDMSNAVLWSAGLETNSRGVNQRGLPVPADIINMSLGMTSNQCAYQSEFTNIEANTNSIIIVAAGNEWSGVDWSTPANCGHSNVITVAAVDRDGMKAEYSNFGLAVDVAAPGGNTGARTRYSPAPGAPKASPDDAILSTLDVGVTSALGASLDYAVGTSMATPVVSGVAALAISRIRETKGSYTRADRNAVLRALRNGVNTFPTTRPAHVRSHIQFCTTATCGSGVIDAENVLTQIDNYLLREGYALPN